MFDSMTRDWKRESWRQTHTWKLHTFEAHVIFLDLPFFQKGVWVRCFLSGRAAKKIHQKQVVYKILRMNLEKHKRLCFISGHGCAISRDPDLNPALHLPLETFVTIRRAWSGSGSNSDNNMDLDTEGKIIRDPDKQHWKWKAWCYLKMWCLPWSGFGSANNMDLDPKCK